MDVSAICISLKGNWNTPCQGCIDEGLALCRALMTAGIGRQGFAAGLGYAYALAGRRTEGRALLEEALRESSHIGAVVRAFFCVVWLSEVCCLAGCLDGGRAYAYQALDLARRHVARGREAVALATTWCDSCPCRGSRCRAGRGPLPPGPGLSRGVGHAPAPGALLPRPWHAV